MKSTYRIILRFVFISEYGCGSGLEHRPRSRWICMRMRINVTVLTLTFNFMFSLKTSSSAIKSYNVVGIQGAGRCTFRDRALLHLLAACRNTIIPVKGLEWEQHFLLQLYQEAYTLRFKPLNAPKFVGDFGCRLEVTIEHIVEIHIAAETYLCSCTAAQSVVHSVLLTNESAITFRNSACASVLFASVILPRQLATQSL